MNGLLKAVAVVALVGFVACSAVKADDSIHYYEQGTKRLVTIEGKIRSESAAGISIKPGLGAAREVPAADVDDVDYEMSGGPRLDYKRASLSEKAADQLTKEDERKKALETALKAYKGLLDELTEAKVKRHIHFKIARLTARLAESDLSQAKTAVKLLKAFTKNNPDTWQFTACSRLLAGLQTANQDYEGAQKTYEELAKTPGIPAAMKQDSELKVAEMMVKAKKYGQAKEKLQDLAKAVQADDPQAVRLNISLAECQAAEGDLTKATQALEGLIAKPMSKALKAQAYNALGDCYYGKKKWKDAMWNYLYVDVVYHQDREEHAKALYYLSKVFKELGDDKKATEYRDRLEKDKQFAGLEYQKLLLLEKSGS
ncbi:MAG TPA: hypothetical protein VG013_31435 [Gemmataceae bacterium]|jgi:tetratricopeptide (TPR) repeat protein|nr:hypothetical protein [Gemmataceae bacterium]